MTRNLTATIGVVFVLSSGGALAAAEPNRAKRPQAITLGCTPGNLLVHADALWVTCIVGPDGPGRVLRLDSNTGEIVASIAVGNAPVGIAGDRLVWVGDHDDGFMRAIDPATDATVMATKAGSHGRFAVAFESLWVVDGGGVLRLHAETGATAARIEVATRVDALAADDSGIWVVHPTSDPTLGFPPYAVSHIDPKTNSVRQVALLPGGANGMVAEAGTLWVASADGLVRISARSGQSTRIVVGRQSTLGSFWSSLAKSPAGLPAIVAGFGSGGLLIYATRNIQTGRPASVHDLTIGQGLVWAVVTRQSGNAIVPVDPRTNKRRKAMKIGRLLPACLAASSDAVWVCNQATGSVLRLPTGKAR